MLFVRAITAQPKPPVTVRTGEDVLLPGDKSSETKKHKETPKEKKFVQTIGNGIINVSKALLTIGIFSYLAIFKIPGTQKVINEWNRFLDDQPKPHVLNVNEKHIEDLTIDHFVANYPIERLKKVIEEEDIKIEKLNANKNKWLFDEAIEIKALINELREKDQNKYREEIELLEEINLTSQLIWGQRGPNIYNTEQNGRENCQIMSAVQGQWLTEDNTQQTKGRITVAHFNPSNPRIDVVVEMNGKRIPVSFEDLLRWMSPETSLQSGSADNSLSTPMLTYAIENQLANYGGVPNKYTSAPATLVTGNDYSSIFIGSLSDEELINVLSKAPNTPTYISTFKYLPQDFPDKTALEQFVMKYKNTMNVGNDAEAEQGISPRDFKGEFFLRNTKQLLERIKSDKANNEPFRRSKYPIEEVSSYHSYTVKEFKNANGEYIVTLIDSNSMEFDLTLQELRQYGRKITSESKNFPAFGEESQKSALLSLAAIIAILAVAYKMNITINPNYKSSLISTGKKLIGLIRRNHKVQEPVKLPVKEQILEQESKIAI